MTDCSAETYYRQLCEHLGVAVVATDVNMNIRTWNAAAARTFGAASERMKGTSIMQIIPQDAREIAEQALRRALDTGETVQFEFQHRDDGGERRELAGTMAPVVSGDGERIGASMCIRDITQRMRLQSEVNESRKMVALGEMAGAITHHFNNMLGGIVTSIDYAGAIDDPAIHQRVLEQTSTALQRALALVGGLSAFAEGDRRVDDLSDLTEIINELVDDYEDQFGGHGIEIEFSPAGLPVIPVARVQVRTVLRNVMQNAIEAMQDGGKLSVDVSFFGESVVILVADTGCGLSEEQKSRVFEPFWSTRGVLASGAGQAMGLGLAIAHGLINMLGGTISVTSEPGKGSCFRVTLPAPDGQ